QVFLTLDIIFARLHGRDAGGTDLQREAGIPPVFQLSWRDRFARHGFRFMARPCCDRCDLLISDVSPPWTLMSRPPEPCSRATMHREKPLYWKPSACSCGCIPHGLIGWPRSAKWAVTALALPAIHGDRNAKCATAAMG